MRWLNDQNRNCHSGGLQLEFPLPISFRFTSFGPSAWRHSPRKAFAGTICVQSVEEWQLLSKVGLSRQATPPFCQEVATLCSDGSVMLLYLRSDLVPSMAAFRDNHLCRLR